jgi:TRAP-type C4-dicarboxylate transport system substrate-binding protein
MNSKDFYSSISKEEQDIYDELSKILQEELDKEFIEKLKSISKSISKEDWRRNDKYES